jgi:hypothetical protein
LAQEGLDDAKCVEEFLVQHLSASISNEYCATVEDQKQAVLLATHVRGMLQNPDDPKVSTNNRQRIGVKI